MFIASYSTFAALMLLGIELVVGSEECPPWFTLETPQLLSSHSVSAAQTINAESSAIGHCRSLISILGIVHSRTQLPMVLW